MFLAHLCRLADQSQVLCGASLGRGNEMLLAASGSHDQDGRHVHIWKLFHALTFAVARGSCLNPRPPDRGFKLLVGDTANVNAWK